MTCPFVHFFPRKVNVSIAFASCSTWQKSSDDDESRLAESYHIISIKNCLILIFFGVMRAVQTIAPTDIPDTKYIISRHQCNPLQSIWIFFTKQMQQKKKPTRSNQFGCCQYRPKPQTSPGQGPPLSPYKCKCVSLSHMIQGQIHKKYQDHHNDHHFCKMLKFKPAFHIQLHYNRRRAKAIVHCRQPI